MRAITSSRTFIGCALVFGSFGATQRLHAQPAAGPQPSIDRYGHLGIGTLTPDLSSILDVQGTDGGFLLPRLTTVQQNAITLPAKSLLVFNLTENAFHLNAGTPGAPNWIPLIDAVSLGNVLADEVWTTEGNAGTNPAQNFLGTTDATDFVIRTAGLERMRVVAGGNIGVGATTPTARLQVEETGAGAANVLQTSTNGAGNAVDATTTGTGSAGDFVVNNGANAANALQASTNGAGDAVDATTTGTGHAGDFAVNNAASSANAVHIETNGTGNVLEAMHSGTAGSAGLFETSNAANNSDVLEVSTVGGGGAGDFSINNAASGADAVRTQTSGTGNALYALNIGAAGGAGVFETTNGANSSTALDVLTVGTGAAGSFDINNPASTADALNAHTNGAGDALNSINSGIGGSAGNLQITNALNDANVLDAATIGNGSAGNFVVNNATSSADAVNAQTNGAGDALNATNSGTAGSAGRFQTTNAAGNANTVDVETVGGGNAGNFVVNNAAGAGSAVNAQTNGTGDALNALNSGSAGSAANLQINNAANNSNTLDVLTVGGGVAIDARNNGTTGGAGTFAITDLNNTSTALDVTTDGEGSAGRFHITNGQSSADALVVGTMGSGNAILSTGDISPSANAAFSLGNTLQRWDRIYVDGLASVHIGTNGNEVDFGYNYNSNLMFFEFTGDMTPEVVMGDDGSLALGSSSLDPSALLSLNSTTKGLLLPRLTSTERDNIPNPATGLLVYNTTTNSYDFNFGTPGTPAWEGFVTTGGTSGWLTEGNTGLTDGTNNLFGTLDNTPIRFVTGSGGPHERMRIDAAGNIGIGTTAPLAPVDILGANSDMILTSVADNLNDSDIRLRRARGVVGAMTPILNGSYDIGTIRGQGYDGDEFVNVATIEFSTDGNVGNNDMPGRIEFFTTPDGSSTPEQRMIIKSDGMVGIGTSNPTKTLEVQDEDADIRVTSRHDSQISQLILRRARDNNGVEEPVQDGDDVAELVGAGWDGSAYEGAARIRFTIDGNPSNGSDMPGRLEFFTTPDGSNSGLERMRIESDGHIGMGTSDPDVKLAIDGGLAIINSSVNATTASTNLSVGNRSYVQVSSDAAAASRAVTIANGSENGQLLIVQCTSSSTNGIRIVDGGNINISTTPYDMQHDDTLSLIWDGDEWIETARANN